MGDFIVTCLQAATPIWLAALAGMYAQRSGVIHLGLEGLMVSGAFVATATAIETGSIALALAAAIVVNLTLSLLFWLLITYFKANVMIVGLGLSLTAAGATGYALVVVFGSEAAVQSPIGLPQPLSGLTGPLAPLGDLSVLTFAAIALTWIAWWSIRRTRAGLKLSACGSDPFAARSAGVPVDRYRLAALQIGGFLCALAGTELSLAGVQSFSDNITQGRGYLAFAAVLLGNVAPIGVSVAALFFGFAAAFGIQSQLDFNGTLPPQFVLMLPYIVTIIAISITAVIKKRRGEQPTLILERTL
ncbi:MULTISPECIES: ABC transporter permease [unclassified Nonomuraea]|uniref:ABC transporter permease n=1 Tax=unclassified Nonomuraea TaxID=2593643 RepID=UPI001BE4911D|nr:ABC transporter permease [Nonomuraea sp. NEAU-A123]MBT2226852.1 ABC transporter permease [Nonomuraea sp. NEAU-A123]